jgi:hypothetical protein
MILCHIIAMNR